MSKFIRLFTVCAAMTGLVATVSAQDKMGSDKMGSGDKMEKSDKKEKKSKKKTSTTDSTSDTTKAEKK